MQRFVSVSFLFYRSVLTYNIIFTLSTIGIIILHGIHLNAGSFLLAKIVGISSAIALNIYQYKQSYFYFRNAGYHMRQVIIMALGLDVLAYITIVLLASGVLQIWHR